MPIFLPVLTCRKINHNGRYPMGPRQKRPRIRLKASEYVSLHKQVLERDGWRCQECGSLKNLQVHHLQPRSQLGGDTMTNLITLCAICHAKKHGR